jgi:autophagy-related protein 13
MQDKRDLEKFIRFMALKAAQIIIQSRSGDKVVTKCKPNSSDTDSVIPYSLLI